MKTKTPQGIAIILMLFIIVVISKYCGNKRNTPVPVSIRAVLNVRAHDINKTLPKDLDAYTRFDKVIYMAPRQLQFNYTLHNINTDSLLTKTLIDSLSTQLLNSIKENQSLQRFIDSNVVFSFQYADSLGQILHTFTFTSANYR